MAIQKYMFFIFIAGWLLFLALVCAVLLLDLPFDVQSDIFLYVFDAFLVLVFVCFFVGKKIYHNLNAEQKNFLKQGALLTALSASIGNLVFIVIDTTMLVFNVGLGDLMSKDLVFVSVLLVEVIVTSIVAIFPALVFGPILAFALLQDSLHGLFSIKSSIIKGTVLGGTLGASLCLAVLILLGYHASFNIWLQRSIIVLILAGLAGGWTGWKLSNSIAPGHLSFLECIQNEQWPIH